MRALLSLLVCAACGTAADPAPAAPGPAAATENTMLAFTYLGVAGWRIQLAGKTTILVDPYLSRPDLERPLVPDTRAILRGLGSIGPRPSLIVIGHSHADHLLDAPTIAKMTGAEIMGSVSTARVARASGVPDEQIITVKGGEDFAFDGFSVKVIPSLHSALGDKHVFGGEIAPDPVMPMAFSAYQEGGTFAYLIRIDGVEILVLTTANFIERELEGLRPDIAIVATGLREEIHDYTCRLMRALGNPNKVFVNHFDDWKTAPPEQPVDPDPDVLAFRAEVMSCSPGTEVTIPRHFEAMMLVVPRRAKGAPFSPARRTDANAAN